MGLNLDDLTTRYLVTSTVTNCFLILFDRGTIDNSSSSNTNVVIFGKHPSIEVRGYIISNIHLRHLLVETHLLLIDLNTLLESNSKVIFTSVHGFRDTTVSSISTHDDVKLLLLGCTRRLSRSELLVLDRVLRIWVGLVVGRNVNGRYKAIDNISSKFLCTITDVLIKDLATAHSNVFISLESITDVNINARGADQLHLADLAVNNSLGQIKLAHHAQRDGPSTGFSII
mmetsp:Transcript_31884/g.73390  ORF Transcript_31884/g.73390 Transcript_31884/m.73390 type:complete len:229 (-) Transcript_31884:318-1004(-)